MKMQIKTCFQLLLQEEMDAKSIFIYYSYTIFIYY